MMKKIFILIIAILSIVGLSSVSFALTYSDYSGSPSTYSGSGTYYSDYSYGTYYSDYGYSTPTYSYDYSFYTPYSYSNYNYYDSCYYYNSCYSTYGTKSSYYDYSNYNYNAPQYYTSTTPSFGALPEPSYTPPNNLVYGGPTPYTNPIPSPNPRVFSCRDPDGYEGERKTFGIGTQGEFQCTQGIWVLVRQIPFVITLPQSPTQNKLDFYGGIRETPVQQNQPLTNPPPIVYTNPINYQQPIATYCVNPTGLNGEVRYFGINNQQRFVCSNGQWLLAP